MHVLLVESKKTGTVNEIKACHGYFECHSKIPKSRRGKEIIIQKKSLKSLKAAETSV